MGQWLKKQNFCQKYLALALAIAGVIVFLGGSFTPARGQLLPLPNVNISPPDILQQESADNFTDSCVFLDGHCLFEVAAKESDLEDRVRDIEQRLRDVREFYLRQENPNFRVRSIEEGSLEDIHVSVDSWEVRLMTITQKDAELEEVEISTRAKQIAQDVERAIIRAKEERESQYLLRQAAIAGATLVVMLLSFWLLWRWKTRLRKSKEELRLKFLADFEPISSLLNSRQQWNLKEIQIRLLELCQVLIVGGGFVWILGLFPYTRLTKVVLLASLKIPLRVAIVGLATYVIIRFSYALINKFAAALAENSLVEVEPSRRIQLRISTISRVTKGITTLSFIAIGIIFVLAWTGVNIGPLLAGAGIIGVALSFASQSLLKDALNGFFIILEDQYAVGDVITVGDVGGLVENINLRITQVRDAEGRLITIPNSEIKIVANHSNGWSRADVSIPISYRTDIDKALELVNRVAQEMSTTADWREQILEPPLVLGVDNFGDRGAIVRIWIKTQALKQWDVAREYRRRLKVALDLEEISIPLPQQEIFYHSNNDNHASLP